MADQKTSKSARGTSSSKGKISRKRAAEEETEEILPEQKKGKMATRAEIEARETDRAMKDMAETLKELRQGQVSKEEIAKIVNEAVDTKITKHFNQLDKKTDKLEERVAKLEKDKGNSSAQPSSSKRGKSSEFISARRSLQLSPCQPSPAAVNAFLEQQMQVPRDIIESLSIRKFEQVFARNLPAHRQTTAKPKVQIELRSIEQRDLLMSFASNLSSGNSIDIVIPDHLKVTARKLEHHAVSYTHLTLPTIYSV